MKNLFRVISLAMLIQLFPLLLFGGEGRQIPNYHINVMIDPSTGMIDCKVEIRNPLDSCFILNKDMEIHRIVADGRIAAFDRDSSNFLPNTIEVIVHGGVQNDLMVEYSGRIKAESYPPIISRVNMIDSNLVELAVYVAWYPHFKNNALFNFELDADMPAGFVTITNGVMKSQKFSKGRSQASWASATPGFDVTLLAAPNFQSVEKSEKGTKVEIYFGKLPREYVESMADSLLEARIRLADFYGEPPVKDIVRIAYSPRDFWGYSRLPFIVVSENKALGQSHEKFGVARDFKYLVHETAHFWWMIADINTPDDWINEGLAEFSSFRVAEEIYGREFADQLVNEYRQHAVNCKTETPIAETENNSPDREVNRYDKATLMFIDAQQKFGAERLDGFFKKLYLRFKDSKNATTELFLDEAEKEIGPEGKTFFSGYLYAKNWPDSELLGK